ncbi:MAG: glycosyltransferase [Flavobacteriales bacterium]|nr:glycosyltransferase [Flavobacteriales bacterium]
MKCAVVCPCYNEAGVINSFLVLLEKELEKMDHEFHIILMDDGSSDETLDELKGYSSSSSSSITLHVFSMGSNFGHQEAIYQGLLCAQELECDRTIVMDSDGEDDPGDIAKLLSENTDVVFAKRRKRSEGNLFKWGYRIYRIIFFLISGKKMAFGNFSVLNEKALNALCSRGFIHYAAALSKQRLSISHVPLDRAPRIGGASKMNYNSLMMHGLRSLVEYSEDLLRSMFRLILLVGLVLLGVGGYVLYTKLFTDLAIQGWASTLSVGLFNALLICISCFILGVLLLNIQLRQPMRKSPRKEKIR